MTTFAATEAAAQQQQQLVGEGGGGGGIPLSASHVPALVMVAALWGATNPLMRRASQHAVQQVALVSSAGAAAATSAGAGAVGTNSFLPWLRRQTWWHLMWMPGFMIPLALNLSGSAVYYRLLGHVGKLLVLLLLRGA